MMILPKITVFSLIYLLKDFLFIPGYTDLFILISGTLSLIIGSCALTQQWNIKRFFAFSSISHIGFILLALYCNDFNSYFLYLFVYIITTINIFSILIILSQYQNRDIKFISQLIGLFHFNPFLSFALALNLFSLAGRCACKIFYRLSN
jgi:NADH:ubiquinone oxidoreductase subunit 2 (subunit N)